MAIELVRGELERLFSLEELLSLSKDLLGFEPEAVGGTASKASFARALVEHCRTCGALAALIDAIGSASAPVSSQLLKAADDLVRGAVDLEAGEKFGPFEIVRELDVGPHGTVFAAFRLEASEGEDPTERPTRVLAPGPAPEKDRPEPAPPAQGEPPEPAPEKDRPEPAPPAQGEPPEPGPEDKAKPAGTKPDEAAPPPADEKRQDEEKAAATADASDAEATDQYAAQAAPDAETGAQPDPVSAPEQEEPKPVVARRSVPPRKGVRAGGDGRRPVVLKILHGSATYDRGALYRFVVRTRLAARVAHDNLPAGLEAGFVDGAAYVAYDAIDGQPLAPRIARTGALHINEARALLHGVLRAMTALHERRLVHGAIKLNNVIVAKTPEGAPRAVLVDIGSDLLGPGEANAAGGQGVAGMSPEQLKGLAATPRSDWYGFGALLFEVICGKPPFHGKSAADLIVAHLAKEPPDAREQAPKGWVAEGISRLCARLLDKDPSRRPATAEAVIDAIGELRPADERKETISEGELNDLIDALVGDPTDAEAAIALELTLDRVESPQRVAEAFLIAADEVDLDRAAADAIAGQEGGGVAEAMAEAAKDRALDIKKGLLFRAARLYESRLKDFAKAEETYKRLLALLPDNAVARVGYEEALRAQEKHEELIEVLLERGQKSDDHRERARALNKIGHLYAGPLDDHGQAVFALAQALAQDLQNDEYAADLERAAGSDMKRWAEAMRILVAVGNNPQLPPEVKMSLLTRLGDWYIEKVARPDLALPCYEGVLAIDPAHGGALEGMTAVYRRAQQWEELVSVLLSRADRAPTPERARDLRAEAASILENRLSDAGRARDLFEQILAEDPAHGVSIETLARIYQREANHAGYAKLLAQQIQALAGDSRAEALCRLAELYEDQLGDLVEAQQRYEAALEIAPGSLTALHGLERIHSRAGRFKELLDNLQIQVRMAATPRQKINLQTRIAGIYDEEFLDHGKAAEALEAILELDPAHEGALTALMRHYRALNRWDDVVSLYERQLKIVTEGERRVELLLSMGRVLLEQTGSPERAIQAYEKVLEIDPQHAGALEALARVRAATGDAMAALSAVESLAESAETLESKAELWIRAAKILEEHGDRDGAIQRYKRALDAKPDDLLALTALREAYLARGDAASAVKLIEREITVVDGRLAKGRLFAQLAELCYDKLGSMLKAKEAATRAVDFDPTNLVGLRLLGDLAFEAGSFVEASTHYAAIAGRVDALPREEGVRVLMQFIDSLARSGSTEKAQDVVPALLELAPNNPDALARAARVRLDSSSAAGAVELYADIFSRFSDHFPPERKVELMLQHGRALRQAGRLDEALVPLSDAGDLAPESVHVIEELGRVYEAQESWEDVVRIKRRLLDLLQGEERTAVLLEIGEVQANRMKDPTRASKTLVAALEERPEDRKVLTRLMRLYSEEKDWSKLVEVVSKLAEGVADHKQKAKYVHTAAVVTAQQIGNLEEAAKLYQQVMGLDPDNDRARQEAIGIREQQGDHEGVLELVRIELAHAETAGDTPKRIAQLDRMASIMHDDLERPTDAIELLEQAQQLDPDNTERAERLTALYGQHSDKYFDKAVAAHRAAVHKNPYVAAPYRALRKLYTEGRQADAAWCLCQVLHCLGFAEPDEERFYRRMRSETAAEAKERVSKEEWLEVLTHRGADPLVSAVFTLIEPAVLAKNAKPLESLGYNPAYALDVSMHPYPMSQTLYYAAGVLDVSLPLTFQNPNDPGGLSFLHARPPAIVLGAAALATELPTQAAAFVAARHLAYYRPGFYFRHLVPTGTGLRAWLFAAIRVVHSAFPVAAALESTVAEYAAAIEPVVVGRARDQLTSVVSKLLQSGAIDLKKWVAGVDLSADRVGFVVAHDLEVASEMVRASDEETAAVPPNERIKELALFSVSPLYFGLRKRLGIGID